MLRNRWPESSGTSGRFGSESVAGISGIPRDANDPNALIDTEPLRISFYKAVATFVRAFASIAQDHTEAGYSDAEADALRREAESYGDTRAAIKKHSGEELDIKPYEADMRHLLNTCFQADPADPQGTIDQYSLVELIIETGIHDAIAKKLNEKGKLSKNAIAEGIINNVRKTIIRTSSPIPSSTRRCRSCWTT